MKQYLVLAALAASAIAGAQTPGPAPQQVPEERAVAAQPPAPAKAPTKAGGPHQLTPEERAELRRQLYQFSRLATKGS